MNNITKEREHDIFKDKLLASVSHDFRGPLGAIMAMTETSLESEDPKKIKKCLKTSFRASHILEILVHDLLDYVQFSNEKLKISNEECNLSEVLKDIKSIMKVQAKKKKIQLLINNEVTEPVVTDPNRLKQVLFNLVGNAIKFTAQGYVRVSVKLCQERDLPGYIEFIVDDTGIGMKSSKIPMLFSQFGKLEQENSQINRRGIGLGLFISQEISKILNPDPKTNGITVKSEEGKGSTFKFILPRSRRKSSELSLPEENHAYPLYQDSYSFIPSKTSINLRPPKIKFIKPLILIVDDDANCNEAMQCLLENCGYNFLSALSGDEAISILLEKQRIGDKVDAMIIDNNMPEKDGYQTIQEILHLRENFEIADFPILILSGDSEQDLRDRYAELGTFYILQKPVNKSKIRSMMRQVLLQSPSQTVSFQNTPTGSPRNVDYVLQDK